MDALTTVRALLTGGALATALAVGVSAPVEAAPRSSGMAAEFPVGTCMATDVGFVPTNPTIKNDQLINVAAVSCTDPERDYRVTAHVAHANQCDASTSRIYTTRDVVVLCVVQDSPA